MFSPIYKNLFHIYCEMHHATTKFLTRRPSLSSCSISPGTASATSSFLASALPTAAEGCGEQHRPRWRVCIWLVTFWYLSNLQWFQKIQCESLMTYIIIKLISFVLYLPIQHMECPFPHSKRFFVWQYGTHCTFPQRLTLTLFLQLHIDLSLILFKVS